MGEHVYRINGTGIVFSVSDDEFGCLCTFPGNDDEKLTIDRIKSLALLGAAVVLAHEGEYRNMEYASIPFCLPEWILDGIRKLPDDVDSGKE